MGIPEVSDVMSRINFSGLISNGRTDLPVIGEGIQPDKEAALGTEIRFVDGRQLEKQDSYGVVLGEGISHALKLRPGDVVTLLVNTAEGVLNTLEVTVVGITQSFSKEYDARSVSIPHPAAHELLNTKGVNSVVVSLKRTEDTQRVAKLIAAKLDGEQFEVKTWQQLNDFYENTVALYQRQFGVLQFIILVMVMLSVANSVNMSVLERVGEFGTMMAIGNRSSAVFRLVLNENFLLAVCGAMLGVLLGLALAWIISAVGIPMPPPPNANRGFTAQIRLLPLSVLTAFGVGFFATVLAAPFPARRVSRIPIVDALLQNI
jgi:putative ABC transport system permease protein